jgi:hypothetical protein
MTRGHDWSLAFTMWRTYTSYFSPTFTGAFSPPNRSPRLLWLKVKGIITGINMIDEIGQKLFTAEPQGHRGRRGMTSSYG